MKKQITRSSVTSVQVAQARLYRIPSDPKEFWRVQNLSSRDLEMPNVIKFWRDYISGTYDFEVASIGNNKPFGSQVSILDGTPDRPLVEIDTYFRRLGTKNENFWDRVRAGDIVSQDDYFISRTLAFFRNRRHITSSVESGNLYHDYSLGGAYPLGPRFETRNTDLGVLPVKQFGSDLYVMGLKRTGVVTEIQDGVIGPEDFGYDKERVFSFIEYLSSNDPNCDLYTETLAEANAATLDLLTTLAEMPKTVRYILGRIKDFCKIITEYQEVKKLRLTKYRNKKKRESLNNYGSYVNKKSINDTTDAALSVWMEYRYAIMTIVYSLQDFHSYLLTLKDVYKTTRKRYSYKAPLDWFQIPSGWTIIENSVDVNDRVWIKRKYDPGSIIDTLLKQLQTNVFKTAWELIPLSFVVDWFVNVGVLIDALTAYSPYLQESQMCSREARGKIIIEREGTRVELQVNTYHRYKLKDSPISFFNIENGLDFVRTIDAIALTVRPIREKLSQVRKTLK